MYTTLSPCDMCTGACLLYKIKRVVIGENKNFVGGEQHLKNRGVEVVVLENEECKQMMEKFIREQPALWYANLDSPNRVSFCLCHAFSDDFVTIIGMRISAFELFFFAHVKY